MKELQKRDAAKQSERETRNSSSSLSL